MSFIWPWMLLLLVLLPVSVWYYRRLLTMRQHTAAQLDAFGVVRGQDGGSVGHRRHLPALFYLIGLFFLIIAAARPELFVSLPRVEGTVILAFDVSSSMMADDFEPTRLAAAQAAARSFVANQPNTIRIGVVAFSNGGLEIEPPTNDEAAVLATIERLTPQGGTSLGQGIFTALNALADNPIAIDPETLEDDMPQIELGQYNSSVIVLLTDGENLSAPDPLLVAQIAAEAGVRIYPIGIGTPEGSVIALDGFNVVTQLNERPLQEIASLTNGTYFAAEDAEALEEIYKNIDLQLTVRGEKMEVTSLVSGIAALFFLIGGALAFMWYGRIP